MREGLGLGVLLLALGCPTQAVDEKEAMRARPKLETSLRVLVSAPVAPAGGPVGAAPELGLRFDGRGRVQVYVRVDGLVSSARRATLEELGLEVELVGGEGVVQGWVAPADLSQLATPAFVKRITPASPGRTR